MRQGPATAERPETLQKYPLVHAVHAAVCASGAKKPGEHCVCALAPAALVKWPGSVGVGAAEPGGQ